MLILILKRVWTYAKINLNCPKQYLVMKKIFYMLAAAAGFLTGCSALIYTSGPDQPVYNDQPQQDYADQPQISQEFYDQLSPYGNWIAYPDYGYVWQPNVDAGFRPYVTDGNWVYTDYGWTWASDFSWGWAPFHYGNWFYDDNYGWLWEPGQQWAPAWVTWGQSGDYYGWAPIPPRENAYGNWRPRDQDWNYIQAQNIGMANVKNYVARDNRGFVNNTTIIKNANTNNFSENRHTSTGIYNRGPNVNEVENFTHSKIQHVTVSVNNRPGQTSVNNNQLNVYRPDLKQKETQGNSSPIPQKVITYRQGNQNQVPQGNGGQGNSQNPNRQQNRPNPDNKPLTGETPNFQLIRRPGTVLPYQREDMKLPKQLNGPFNNQNHDQPFKKALIMNQNAPQQQVARPQQSVRPPQQNARPPQQNARPPQGTVRPQNPGPPPKRPPVRQ